MLDLTLRSRAGRKSPVTKRTCIVIVEVEAAGERHDMGLVVDTVNAVLDIPAQDIEPPPAFWSLARTDYIQGMAKVNNRFVDFAGCHLVLATEELLAISGGRRKSHAIATRLERRQVIAI